MLANWPRSKGRTAAERDAHSKARQQSHRPVNARPRPSTPTESWWARPDLTRDAWSELAREQFTGRMNVVSTAYLSDLERQG